MKLGRESIKLLGDFQNPTEIGIRGWCGGGI